VNEKNIKKISGAVQNSCHFCWACAQNLNMCLVILYLITLQQSIKS